MSESFKVHSALLTVGVIYALNYSIAKAIMPAYFQPFGLIVLRVCFAAVLFAIFMRKSWIAPASLKDGLHLAVCAFFGIAANQLMFFKGLSMTTPVHASVIMTTTPILVSVIAAIALREAFTLKKGLGLFLGAFGAIFLITKGTFAFEAADPLGDIFIFLNACSYGIYLVIVKPLMKKYPPMSVITTVFVLGFPMVLPFGIMEVMEVPWEALSLYSWGALFFIIFCTTFMAYGLNAYALKHVGAGTVGYYIYVQPVFASILSISIGSEEAEPYKWIAALCIFAGVYGVTQSESSR